MRPRCAELISKRLAPPGATQLGSPAELVAADPGFGQLIEPEKPLHSGWLKTLKASARNSKAICSLMAKCLNIAMSKLTRPGLRRLSLPELPKVSPVGTEKAPGL